MTPDGSWDPDNLRVGRMTSRLNIWEDEVQNLARSLGSYFTGETWFEASWRTVIASTTAWNDEVPRTWSQLLQFYGKVSRCFIFVEPEVYKTWDANVISSYDIFLNSLKVTMQGRVFGITRNGWMGVFPHGSVTGDQICIFHGHETPFVIRQVNRGALKDGQTFQLIGECSIHGIMDGKPWEVSKSMRQSASYWSDEVFSMVFVFGFSFANMNCCSP
jgi:hypothetical protein